jgi:glycosyltransferase involved in cell wall biosynthesis
LHENTKRVSFLQFADLPRLTSQPLELALYLADDDGEDRQLLEDRGWRVHHSRELTRTPEMYQTYIQRSRGEFSCAKPSCMTFQNAWVSDRTLCYLASGKPVVVQDTGPSSVLPHGLGMFRFSTLEQAAEALQAVNADYARHCRAARELAEAYFDATKIAERILDVTLG